MHWLRSKFAKGDGSPGRASQTGPSNEAGGTGDEARDAGSADWDEVIPTVETTLLAETLLTEPALADPAQASKSKCTLPRLASAATPELKPGGGDSTPCVWHSTTLLPGLVNFSRSGHSRSSHPSNLNMSRGGVHQ